MALAEGVIELISGQDMSVSLDSSVKQIKKDTKLSFNVNWSGLTGVGKVKFQASNDASTNFFDLPIQTATGVVYELDLSTSSGSIGYSKTLGYSYYKVSYDANTATTGTVSINVNPILKA